MLSGRTQRRPLSNNLPILLLNLSTRERTIHTENSFLNEKDVTLLFNFLYDYAETYYKYLYVSLFSVPKTPL